MESRKVALTVLSVGRQRKRRAEERTSGPSGDGSGWGDSGVVLKRALPCVNTQPVGTRAPQGWVDGEGGGTVL